MAPLVGANQGTMEERAKVTMQVPLSNGGFALVDEEDHARIASHSWYAWHHHGTSYAARMTAREGRRICILMHREVMDAQPGSQVDHSDGNGLNNQRSNLRFCTPSENRYNQGRQRNNSSGLKGVSWNKKLQKWEVYINKDRKRTRLGFFADKNDAMRAYDKAAAEMHGDFARPNKPETEKRVRR